MYPALNMHSLGTLDIGVSTDTTSNTVTAHALSLLEQQKSTR